MCVQDNIMLPATMISSSPLVMKELNASRDSLTSVSRDSLTSVTLEDDDLWNLDLDDIMDMRDDPESHPGESLAASLAALEAPVARSGFLPGKRRSACEKRSVSFDKVEIRVFERVLGNNPPAVFVGGPSLALGWAYKEKKAIDIEKFETRNGFQWGTRRRGSKDLVMTPEKREKLARRLGFSGKEIRENVKEMENILKQRERTFNKELERNTCDSSAITIMERARRSHGFIK